MIVLPSIFFDNHLNLLEKMGIAISKSTSQEEQETDTRSIEEYFAMSGEKLHFVENKGEINNLRQKYCRIKLISQNTGILRPEYFINELGLSNIEVGKLIFQSICPQNELPEFRDFLLGLNKFHPLEENSKAADTVFNLYKTGENISFDGLRKIIEYSLQDNELMTLSEAKLDILVDQLIRQFNADGDSSIDRIEFRNIAYSAPGIIRSLQLNLEELFSDLK